MAGGFRERDILKVFSPRTVARLATGAARARFDREFLGTPLAACWFINFRCNAGCRFCCKKEEIRESHRFPELDPEGKRALLRRIRKSVDLLYISGGEPLLQSDLDDVVRYARELRFRQVGLTTNLIHLRKRTEILEHLDVLCTSLHGATPESHARQMGIPEETAGLIFENIRWLAEYDGNPNLKKMINFVVTEKNVEELEAVAELARELGFVLELVPENDERGIATEVLWHPKYRDTVEAILDGRSSDQYAHVCGSRLYLERILTGAPFRCYPLGVPNITPDGRLCAPCDKKRAYGPSILDHDSLDDAVAVMTAEPDVTGCDRATCFKAGIIERSVLFDALSG